MAEQPERLNGWVNSIRELAAKLGMSVGRTHGLTKEPWFPTRATRGWDLTEVQRAMEAREAPSSSDRPEGEDDGEEEEPRASSPIGTDDLQVLEAGTDPVAIARTAMRIASRQLAEAGPREKRGSLESLKRTLEELRRTDQGFMAIARERGELIDLEIAKTLVGEAVTRAIRVLERYEVLLASKIESLLADATFAALSPEERARSVRSWAREQTYSLRTMQADELDRMIAAEAAERAGD